MDFNRVIYTEYIDIRSKLWYLDIEGVDTAVTHKSDECLNDRWLVPKANALEPIEELALRHRAGDTSLSRYLTNDFIDELRSQDYDECYVFLASAVDVQKLSSDTKVWWFGRDVQDLGVCASVRQPPAVLKTAKAPVEVGLFDVVVRRDLLNYRCFLRKYTKQPYFIGGRFLVTKGEGSMIIELRELPDGVAIKPIDCHIEFSQDGSVKKVDVTPVKAAKPTRSRPENIAPEMQDLKF